MHLVSIIYLFISASKFGPGSHLKWCLTKWQLFFWWAGVAKTSASALQLQQFLLLRYVAFHEGSDRLAKSRQNPTDFDWNSTLLTAGLGTSVCDVIQRLEGEGIFFPWLSRPPSAGDQSGTASQLSLEVVFTICLCTSKNTLVLIEIYSMSSASIPCRLQHRTPPVLELALHSCVPRGICAKRKKKTKRKVTNWADPPDLGTFGDLTAFCVHISRCLWCQAKINFREPPTLIARIISLPPGTARTSSCQLRQGTPWETSAEASLRARRAVSERGLASRHWEGTRRGTSRLFPDRCQLLRR